MYKVTRKWPMYVHVHWLCLSLAAAQCCIMYMWLNSCQTYYTTAKQCLHFHTVSSLWMECHQQSHLSYDNYIPNPAANKSYEKGMHVLECTCITIIHVAIYFMKDCLSESWFWPRNLYMCTNEVVKMFLLFAYLDSKCYSIFTSSCTCHLNANMHTGGGG